MSDLIKRTDAIKAILSKPAWHGSDGSFYHSSDIKDAINNLPSTEKKQKLTWIPCSERLPEYGELVLMSALMPLGTKVYIGYLSDGSWFCDRLWFRIDDVLAWMPLPEPYE